MKSAKRQRADELLVERGLAESRTKARALILAGKVHTPSARIEKAGMLLDRDAVLTVARPPRFVGRGGDKLEGFLEASQLSVEGLPFLDVGASTGGFTDALLQRGAGPATCVDVGRNQLHQKLRSDPRVTSLEKINARNLEAGLLPRTSYPLIVMDLSFISLRLVVHPVWKLLETEGCLVALVKPQFEATREEASAGKGVIRDKAIRERILQEVTDFALSELESCEVYHVMECTVAGTDGNREYFLGLRKRPRTRIHPMASR